jgi:hypothetical protein
VVANVKLGYLTMTSIGSYGRFANGMFQIAAILGIGRRNRLEPVFPLWQNLDHRDRFGSAEDIDLYRHLVFELPAIPPRLSWQPERPIGWGYHDVRLPAGNWNISGHFQSPRYFNDVLDTVRHYLTFKDEPSANDYCGVHLRYADYDNRYHPRLDRRYYEPALARFPASQRFLVFSDDLELARATLGNGPSFDYSEGRDYIEDFKLLKNCRDFIIGNSSYSAMAAILGAQPGKRVVAPSPWFGPAYTSITGDDIYDEGWEVVRWS